MTASRCTVVYSDEHPYRPCPNRPVDLRGDPDYRAVQIADQLAAQWFTAMSTLIGLVLIGLLIYVVIRTIAQSKSPTNGQDLTCQPQ